MYSSPGQGCAGLRQNKRRSLSAYLNGCWYALVAAVSVDDFVRLPIFGAGLLAVAVLEQTLVCTIPVVARAEAAVDDAASF